MQPDTRPVSRADITDAACAGLMLLIVFAVWIFA